MLLLFYNEQKFAQVNDSNWGCLIIFIDKHLSDWTMWHDEKMYLDNDEKDSDNYNKDLNFLINCLRGLGIKYKLLFCERGRNLLMFVRFAWSSVFYLKDYFLLAEV